VEVRSGGYLITAYPKNDLGLRNLAIYALTESKVSGQYVADLFGLSPVQVSRIRGDYRQHGSAGLAKKRGRRVLLGDRQVRQARLWAGEKVKHGEIARRLKVSRPLIVALLKEHGPLHPDQPLDSETPWDTGEPTDKISRPGLITPSWLVILTSDRCGGTIADCERWSRAETARVGRWRDRAGGRGVGGPDKHCHERSVAVLVGMAGDDVACLGGRRVPGGCRRGPSDRRFAVRGGIAGRPWGARGGSVGACGDAVGGCERHRGR
jgi:hypothetical protein